MKHKDQVALLIEWDEGVDLPSIVGPFGDVREAAQWATLNIPNGTWEFRALSYPYAIRRGADA